MGKLKAQPQCIADRVRDALQKESALVIIPKYNAPKRRDVTGAFRPESKRARALFGLSRLIEFDNRQVFGLRRSEVLRKMRDFEKHGMRFNTVMVFSHGWATGIQAGFDRSKTRVFAKAIQAVMSPNADIRVPLYCCSTGDDPNDRSTEASGTGENSFADQLRDALCELGAVHCFVMGHDTAGHTTRNPNSLRFAGAGSKYGGIGGFKIVTPGSRLWPKWRQALRKGDFRYRFPHMNIIDIHEELAGG